MLLLRIPDTNNLGPVGKHEQEKRATCERNLLEMLSGQGEDKWQLGVSVGEAMGSGGVCGKMEVLRLMRRKWLLFSSSQSPPCRDDVARLPAFYEK